MHNIYCIIFIDHRTITKLFIIFATDNPYQIKGKNFNECEQFLEKLILKVIRTTLLFWSKRETLLVLEMWYLKTMDCFTISPSFRAKFFTCSPFIFTRDTLDSIFPSKSHVFKQNQKVIHDKVINKRFFNLHFFLFHFSISSIHFFFYKSSRKKRLIFKYLKKKVKVYIKKERKKGKNNNNLQVV